MNTRSKAVTVSISAALLAASIAWTGATTLAKVPGDAPVTLDLEAGLFSNDWSTDLFASKVDELSDGSLVINYVGEVAESEVASRVQAGEADLGQVMVRGLDQIGGSEFRALLAPFLVTDSVLSKAIVTGSIGADMLSGLQDEGLVGLTLAPGDRRFVRGLGRPLTSLADFAGQRVQVPPTTVNDAFVRALGAEPMDDVPGATSADLLAAGVTGRVTVMGQSEVEDEYLISNLAVHTVPVAWFINADVMAELSPDHQEVLREAASYIQAQKLEETADVESTLAFCATGGTIVEAAPGDVAQIIEAAQPVVDMLTTDPVTAEFIARIHELKAVTEPAPFPALCGGPSITADLARIPDGTYTTALTEAYAVETGWRDCVVDEGRGVSILIIEGASWAQLQGCGDGIPEQGADGTFEYVGDQAIMREPGIPGQATFTWSMAGDTLTLKLVETDEEYAPTSVLRFLFEHDFTAGSAPASNQIPDGTYTAAATRAWALETGFPDECALADLGKSVTLVIQANEWTELQKCGADPAFVGSFGTLQYERDHVVLKEDFLEQGPVYAWSIDGDVLSMELVDPIDPGEEAVLRFLFEHEFTRSLS